MQVNFNCNLFIPKYSNLSGANAFRQQNEAAQNDRLIVHNQKRVNTVQFNISFAGRVLLAILDGFGIDKPDRSPDEKRNPITRANVPNIMNLMKSNPYKELHASGWEVGLPKGQMGNSEVGHLNLGAGRIVDQDITIIDKAIESGAIYENQVLLQAMNNAKITDENGIQTRSLHLMGLVSNGGVHSHNNHLKALIRMAKKEGIKNVYVHAFLDGRDTPPRSAVGYVNEINEVLKECGYGEVSSVMGRYYAMDRDNRWDRVEKAYKNLTEVTDDTAETAEQAITNFYTNAAKGDEFVLPTAIGNDEIVKKSRVKSNDSVIFFNFRSDRARELTRALTDEKFNEFPTKVSGLSYVCMTKYDNSFNLPIAFPKEDVVNTLGEVISKKGIKQFRTAESEKNPHITFFFNGGKELQFPNEERQVVPSPKVATYDLQPEMSAVEVKDNVIDALRNQKDKDFILVNFANPDMVGHTGSYEATENALKTVDKCIKEIADAAEETQTTMIITADHGNAEKMKDEKGKPHTAHTTNPVPFVLIDNAGESDRNIELRKNGCLADVAPTVLELMDLEQPVEMTGKSLII